MDKYYIRGMEQLGVGVTDVNVAWKWYRENFGADIKILDDDSEAKYMLRYTGGVPHRRHAILAVSLQGGGGFEIWQYKSHESTKPLFDIQLGDLGIFAGKIKTDNLEKAHVEADKVIAKLKAEQNNKIAELTSQLEAATIANAELQARAEKEKKPVIAGSKEALKFCLEDIQQQFTRSVELVGTMEGDEKAKFKAALVGICDKLRAAAEGI